jgi:hypothetical protein
MTEPTQPGEPAPGADDPMAPPAEPVLVHGAHCNQEYMSSEIRYESRGEGGFWVCRTPGCSGAGFGFDIFPIDGAIEGPGGFMGGWFDDDGNRVPPPWLRGEEG